jgi:hypothetical protein
MYSIGTAMHGDGYVVNLISEGGNLTDWDDDNDQSSPPEALFSTEEVTPGMRPSRKRTKNFSDQEDEMLVLSWLNTCTDTTQGIDQPRSPYWMRIHDYFHANRKFNSERSQNSLMHRWSVIQDSVKRFTECLDCIEDTMEGELSSDDKVSLYVRSSRVTSYVD